jgi:hypothetical protein
VAKDNDRACADEPEERGDRGSPPKDGKADHEERGIEVLLRNRVFADLRCFRCYSRRSDERREGRKAEEDAPNLLMRMKPPMRKTREMRRREFVMTA